MARNIVLEIMSNLDSRQGIFDNIDDDVMVGMYDDLLLLVREKLAGVPLSDLAQSHGEVLDEMREGLDTEEEEGE